MKKLAFVLLLVLAASMVASAVDSNLYVKTLYIEKVYSSTYGFKIEYRRTNSLFFADAYLPIGWFGGPEAKAKIVYADDNSVPFVNIFWEQAEPGGDLEFSHLVLYVHRSIQHLSWGDLRNEPDLQSKFDIDEPQFVF